MQAAEITPKPEGTTRWQKARRWSGKLFGTMVVLGMLAAGWEFRQFSEDPARYLVNRYGRGLGKVTAVEVLSLGPEASTELAARFPGLPKYRRRGWSEDTDLIYRQETIRGDVAQRFADLWRRQDFITEGKTLCHEPGYAIRFYFGPWKRLEVTVCWQCDNIAFPLVGTEDLISFDAHGTNGLALLSSLKAIAPAFDYTNSTVAPEELRHRVSRVLGKQEPALEFVEWVLHSPQRDDFIAEVGRRLLDLSADETTVAIGLVGSFKLTNQAPALELMLGHTNRFVRNSALKTLQSLRVPVSPDALLPLLVSEKEWERQESLMVAVRRTAVDPAFYLPAIERSLATYGRQAFPPSTRESLRKLTNRWPAWSPIYDRLRRGTNAPAG